MDTTHTKLAFQVQFWGLIGPLIASITLFVILIKSPPEAIYLSIATIVGLVASWKWKLRGALLSIGLMLLLYLYHFSEIDPNDHFWHIGMNLSIILGFAITALSLQEVEQLLQGEAPYTVTDEIKSEDEKTLEEEIAAKSLQITDYSNLVEIMRKNAKEASRQHEKLLQEFMVKQNELSLAQESLHIKTRELSSFIEKPKEGVETLEIKTKEIERLKKQLEELQKGKQEKKNVVVTGNGAIESESFSELKSTNELLSRERGRLESLLFRTQIELHQKTEDLLNLPHLEQEIKELKFQLAATKEETHALQQKLLIPNELEIEVQNLRDQVIAGNAKKEQLEIALKEKTQVLEEEKELKNRLEASKNLLERQVESEKQALFRSEKQFAEETERKRAILADLAEKEQLLFEIIEAKQALEVLNENLKQQLEQKQEEQEEAISPVLISSEKLPFEFKKIKGRYEQLREQFDLKSDVLDETRKELFQKEESLKEAELKLNELQIYHFSESEAFMHSYLLNVIAESEKRVSQLSQEIEELQVLIASLIK